MKTSIRFVICLWIKLEVPIFIIYLAQVKKSIVTLSEIVVVDKLVAGVIWRVNVDHLDLAEIVLTKDFQHIEIIALDIKIFGVPKIHRSIHVWTQRLVGRSIGKT